jgi:hypothetical protein
MKMGWMLAISIAAGLCYGGACCIPPASAVLATPAVAGR